MYTLNVCSRGKKLVLFLREFCFSRDEVDSGALRFEGKQNYLPGEHTLIISVCYVPAKETSTMHFVIKIVQCKCINLKI